RQLDQAILENRALEALELAKVLALKRDYLVASDRDRCRQLLDRTRAWEGGAAQGSGRDPGTQMSDTLARNKLAHARALLAQGRFDAADQLAQEVEGMHATFATGELTPHKLREEIAADRKDARFLLTTARTAFNNHDLDLAETLAKQSDSSASMVTFVW